MKSGRNGRIENPRQLAAEFACRVTAEANDGTEYVAKNSDHGLFKVLQRMLPEVSSLVYRLVTPYSKFLAPHEVTQPLTNQLLYE